jgi:tryptophanyl-tRNA synthetase
MKILSGVQPTGNLHIGNYLGSVNVWVNMLKQNPDLEALFMIVDLHAITVYQDPAKLRQKIYEVLAIYLASGIDPEKHTIFVQSQNPDHTYLGWLLNCIASVGQLERMTQYKDKREKQETKDDIVSMGLMDYPVLMAADILLYDADKVPVGKDQKQHVELTRDLAERFNSMYGQTFTVPEFVTMEETAKILDLQNPAKKMSKSDENPAGKIDLMDTPQGILDKIKRAVTDSESIVKYDMENKPGISNLMAIYGASTGKTMSEIEQEFAGKNYGIFKNTVGEAVVEFLIPLQKSIREYLSDLEQLDKIVNNGNKRAREISEQKLSEVTNKMGVYYHGPKKQ